ncbi:MAG TPA: FixH family protein [Novosphingobium sp.]|nr:FixH family protein [Novosphingobium sp.]
MTTHAPRKPFNGRHMAAILVAGFGVVIAVNFTMAGLASSTFGGVVVENSYVASQHFNRWLDEADKEKALGWSVDARQRTDGRVVAQVGLGGPVLRQARDERSGRGKAGAETASGERPRPDPAQAEPVEAPAALTAIARHPLGRLADVPLTFREQSRGEWLSTEPLPPGRWTLRFEMTAQGRTWRAEEPISAGTQP